jgi:hypothetical protein
MLYEYKFLISLAFTLFVEVSLLFILIKFFFKRKNKRITNPQLLFTGFLGSFATLPYLWFILPLFINTRAHYILFGEISVILMESFIIRFMLRIDYKKSLVISLICNLASFLLGLIFLNL